jgi:hypothetical protein
VPGKLAQDCASQNIGHVIGQRCGSAVTIQPPTCMSTAVPARYLSIENRKIPSLSACRPVGRRRSGAPDPEGLRHLACAPLEARYCPT